MANTGLGDARFINPSTGQPEIVNGQFGKMPRTRQRVMLAMGTALGSASASQKVGVRRPPKMGNGFENELKQALLAALRQLTDVERLISIRRIDVIRNMTRSQATVSYVDLVTGSNQVASIG